MNTTPDRSVIAPRSAIDRPTPPIDRPITPARWTYWAMGAGLVMTAAVYGCGAYWSWAEQTRFAAGLGFDAPFLLAVVLDGLVFALAVVGVVASFQGRTTPAVTSFLVVLVGLSSVSNGASAWERTANLGVSRQVTATAVAALVPIIAAGAWELILHELRTMIATTRAPWLVKPRLPGIRAARVVLSPRTLGAWRRQVLAVTTPVDAVTGRPIDPRTGEPIAPIATPIEAVAQGADTVLAEGAAGGADRSVIGGRSVADRSEDADRSPIAATIDRSIVTPGAIAPIDRGVVGPIASIVVEAGPIAGPIAPIGETIAPIAGPIVAEDGPIAPIVAEDAPIGGPIVDAVTVPVTVAVDDGPIDRADRGDRWEAPAMIDPARVGDGAYWGPVLAGALEVAAAAGVGAGDVYGSYAAHTGRSVVVMRRWVAAVRAAGRGMSVVA